MVLGAEARREMGEGLSPRPRGALGWLHPLHPGSKGRGWRGGSWSRRVCGGSGVRREKEKVCRKQEVRRAGLDQET